MALPRRPAGRAAASSSKRLGVVRVSPGQLGVGRLGLRRVAPESANSCAGSPAQTRLGRALTRPAFSARPGLS